MADSPMDLRQLRRAVKRYGGWEDPSKGKGSHTMFFRVRYGGTFSYPIPTHDKEVKKHYVKGLRERLGLTASDGVPDADFYNS
jgi:hypothetical protein